MRALQQRYSNLAVETAAIRRPSTELLRRASHDVRKLDAGVVHHHNLLPGVHRFFDLLHELRIFEDAPVQEQEEAICGRTVGFTPGRLPRFAQQLLEKRLRPPVVGAHVHGARQAVRLF